MSTNQQNYDINLLKQACENLRQSLHKAFNAIDQQGREIFELQAKVQRLEQKLTKVSPQSTSS